MLRELADACESEHMQWRAIKLIRERAADLESECAEAGKDVGDGM